MKFDIVIAGVGGQGVITAATFISRIALSCGLSVKQSEVHGMAQRGGTVVAQLRIGDGAVESSLIRRGGAGLIIGFEPLEALRVLPLLAVDGRMVTSTDQVRNFSDYPATEVIDDALGALHNCIAFSGSEAARTAGVAKASSMVIAGAASRYIPFFSGCNPDTTLGELIKNKGDTVVAANLRAFHVGASLMRK